MRYEGLEIEPIARRPAMNALLPPIPSNVRRNAVAWFGAEGEAWLG
jgi:hypothetical protein